MEKIKYWAFEGSEGTGKTVLSKAFAERIEAVWTYEPNEENEALKAIEKVALKTKGITDSSREFLLLANRSIHHEKIINPLVESGKTIVSDRSFFSGMVYANIQTYTPSEWTRLYELARIKHHPQIVIFCRSSKQQISKEEGDVYDNADQSFLAKIDASYKHCLNHMKLLRDTPHLMFSDVQVVEFFNDFNKPIEENLDILINQLKKMAEIQCPSCKHFLDPIDLEDNGLCAVCNGAENIIW